MEEKIRIEKEKKEKERIEKERKEKEEREKLEKERIEKEQKEKEEKERKEKEEQEEQERLEKERIEREQKEKEEKERIERELKEKEEREKAHRQKEEKDLILKEQRELKEKERKLKEEKLLKEKEKKEQEEKEKILKELEEKEKEKNLKEKKEKIHKEKKKKENDIKESKEIKDNKILEEIKNNEHEKQNKDKEKEFIASYINSLDKRKNDFNPIIYRHPEKIYLKAINDYEINKEKMKKINHKAGQFNLILNRTKINKYFINSENKQENIHIKINNDKDKDKDKDKLKSNNNININNENNKSKNYEKKKLLIKVGKSNLIENNYFTNYKSPNKTTNNIYSLNSKSSQKLIPKKIENKRNANTIKKVNSEENREISLNEMVQFLLENKKELNHPKKSILSNPINHRKAAKQKKQIINSLNDPFNPYSALFYNNMLYTNYNVGMHYKNIKQGVPNLRIKKIKRNSLPPLFMGNNTEQRMLSNTFSSKFSSNKKKNVLLPVTSNCLNNMPKKRLYTEENEKLKK